MSNETYSMSHYLTPEQQRKIADFNACRTIEKGGQIICCPQCHTKTIYYNPCNQRGCPRCYKKNQLEWNKKLKKKLIKAGHYHLVISVPDDYKDIWLLDAKTFINSFFYAVDKGFKKLQKELGLILGVVNVFQSHGTGLCYKPHIHCIVTSYGLNKLNQLVEVGSMKYSTIRDVVAKELGNKIQSNISHDQLEVTSFILNKSDLKRVTVYPTIHKKDGESIVNYLSKSISGVAVNIDMLDHDKERNKIIVRDNHNGNETITELDLDTFKERYLNHIPPKGVVTIRNYGLYSNKNRQRLEKLKRYLGEEEEEEDEDEDEKLEICPECHCDVLDKIVFKPHDNYPLILKLYLRKFEDPPKHGCRLEL